MNITDNLINLMLNGKIPLEVIGDENFLDFL